MHRLMNLLCMQMHRWLYLEPILSNEEGELGVKFRKVDQVFRQVARIIETDPRLTTLLQSTRLQPMLDSITDQLHACQSALNQYIDEKRKIFPRFYFLSDDDLLELLGQARSGAEGRELIMQTHLKKLFPGITCVKLGPENMSITTLCSHHEEKFMLEHPVDIDCTVEVWLKNLEDEMRSSLKSAILKYVTNNTSQNQDVFSLPVQVLCLAQNIRFTEQAERAILSKELHKLKTIIDKEINYYSEIELNEENEKLKRQALILQCVYYVNIIRLLIDNNITTTNHWLWQKQLRFYLLNTQEVVAKMGLAEISYSYEYLGVNTGQFVRTDLADQCFLILTQAFHLGLVGNPFGPAGTGKTESVKALGGLVGRLVLVFNCDEVMDAECMGRLLTGLAMCGAWGCFDEFNRLTAETLAVVSHQFASLLTAISDRTPATKPIAILNDKEVSVSEWCAVAATMNPAGREYGGRRALPAALERVLRPAAMLRPRARPLAAHLLRARAFAHADRLASDLHQVYSMARELLSDQRHYDWGLRAVKATVGSCASALRAAAGLAEQRATLRRMLRHNNISKLTSADAKRFEKVLSVVFYDVPEEETFKNPIIPVLNESAKTLGLIANSVQIQKCVELYEQLQQRMGIIIVGPPGSGKTTIRQLLKTALTQQGKNIVEYVISPKAMSRNCLLGHIDVDTRQWTDGVISATALEISNQPPDVWSWVVCDGDVDPEWIEALNSVLDDNRLLTLPSGWRVQFGPNVNFLFETDSLEHASPATISRMGIILLSEENSCAKEFLNIWLGKIETDCDKLKEVLLLLRDVIAKCLKWCLKHKSDFQVEVYTISIVKQILIQFEYIMRSNETATTYISPEEIVYLSLQRSIIGSIKQNSLEKFHLEVMAACAGAFADGEGGAGGPGPLTSRRLARAAPAARAVAASPSPHAHLLVTGPPASAKNVLADYILKDTSDALVIDINCTPILEVTDIIRELKKNNVVRSSGSVHSRNEGVNVILLVRSLHRAHRDSWGSSAIQSFLLQIIQHGGFWEEGGEGARGVQWRGARVRVAATAAAARAPAPRLAAALCAVSLAEPDDDELMELANHCLSQNVQQKIVPENEVSNIVQKMLTVYKEALETFNSQLHYNWNASDLKKWCDNIKWYTPSNLEELLSAVCYEANSIFSDRLQTDNERQQFGSILTSQFQCKNESIYYATKLRSTGVYMECADYRDWYQSTQKIIQQCLTEHEYSIFGDSGAEVCVELATLCPAIARSTNGEVVVSVASAGAGRRAAALVVAASLPATPYFVNYASEFHAQFKNAVASASEDGTRVLLIVCAGAASDAALGAIEAWLRTRRHNTQLVQNANQNLGIVIILDKDDAGLPAVMGRFPLLYGGRLLWRARWAADTVRRTPQLVVQRLIKDDVAEGSCDEHESIPVEGFVNIYESLDAEWMKAPCRYVNFIKTYYHIVRRKKTALVQKQKMLSAGVAALRRARAEAARLEAAAREQEAALGEKRAAAAAALEQIAATARAAAAAHDDMRALRDDMRRESDSLLVRKKEIEEELASVEPVIAAARAAVGDIRSESLSEIRSLRAPPDVVRDVLEGVLRLMGIADTSWHSMKNFLSKRGVKEDIRCLDASAIGAEAAQSVRRLLEARGASFEERAARRASAACAPLAAWVRANVAYAAVLQRVQPLQAQQRQLHGNIKEAEDRLANLSSGLESVEERVSSLKEQLGQHTREAVALEMKLNEVSTTLDTARGLLEQLSHEYSAWENDLEVISKEISELNVRSLLAAAFIVYLSDVTEPQSKEYIRKWSEIIGFENPEFSVINFLTSTEKQLKWDADGLPLDKSAIKNAVIIDQFLEPKKCGFTPYIIDPDGDAFVWLKKTLSAYPVDFISQHSDKLQTAIQHAIRFGRVLVLTDVSWAEAGAGAGAGAGAWRAWWAAALGLPPPGCGAPAACRLLLHSRDPAAAARLPPHCRANLSVLHFTARIDGLTDQLIQFSLQRQNPEMNEKSKELKLRRTTLQREQYELQEKLLRELSGASDILHDANLVASLKETRAAGATAADALRAARRAGEREARARGALRPSARRAAALALAVRALAPRRAALAAPPEAALRLYAEAVHAENPENYNDDEIIKHFTRRIIDRVLLGLRKDDKYVIILYLLKQVYDDLIPDELWEIFIGSDNVMVDDANVREIKLKYPWILESCIKRVAMLQVSCVELFNKLNLDNTDFWTTFVETGELNAMGKLNLSAFENIIVVATLRPVNLYGAIIAFVDQVLGAGAAGGGAGGEVARAAACAGALRPVLLLSAHARDLLRAHAADRSRTLHQVGVEGGAGAWEAAVERARGGDWLLLTVAAAPFTPQLQTFLADFPNRPAELFDPEFRLWITCEDREVPSIVLNSCLNVIIEAPDGVKNNVLNTLSAWGNFESPDVKLVRTLACIALLHAVIQERRAYVPEGWSRRYGFEWGDVAASARAARGLARGAGAGAAGGLCAALYGGRVRAAADARVLAALVRDWLAEHVFAHGWVPRGLARAPPLATRLQDYTAAFSELPSVDSAAMLGLPANCKVAWENKMASNIISSLKEISCQGNLNDKVDHAASLKPLLNFWKKLMSGNPLLKDDSYDENNAEGDGDGDGGGGGGGGWWASAARVEAGEAARAVRRVHRALTAARLRPRRAPLTVPDDWQLLWSGPDAPDKYIKELSFRAHAAVKRVRELRGDGRDLPAEVDLREWLRPARVLSCLRMRAARRLGHAPAALRLRADWEPRAEAGEGEGEGEGEREGVRVAGLRLSGAAWRGGALGALAAAAPPHAPAPPLLLRYRPQESEPYVADGYVEIPVYNNGDREEVVFHVQAPAGAALDAHAAALHAVALFIAEV